MLKRTNNLLSKRAGKQRNEPQQNKILLNFLQQEKDFILFNIFIFLNRVHKI